MVLDEGGPVPNFIKAQHDSATHGEIVLDIQTRYVYIFRLNNIAGYYRNIAEIVQTRLTHRRCLKWLKY